MPEAATLVQPITVPPVFWGIFFGVVALILSFDLGVFNRKAHKVTFREACGWTIVWVTLAIVFNVGIFWKFGASYGKEFLAAYLLEQALSVDNLFVFIMLFGFFKLPDEYQHKVLFWGIIGAVVMRAIFIYAGVELILRFSWLNAVFGALLLWSGYKLLRENESEPDLDKNLMLRISRKLFKVTSDYRGSSFFVRENGALIATPMFILLILVEGTDVLFALDSIPAVIGVVNSKSLFIIYTSNVFAILGLRSLFFMLHGVMGMFHLINYGLALILMFIGVKMILILAHIHVGIEISLGVVVGVLAISVIASIMFPKKAEAS